MIFLVNRLGDVNTIAAPFLEVLDRDQLELLFRQCAWCTTWYEAAELARKRKRAIEEILAHDHNGEAGRADVLLRPGVDDAVLRPFERPRQGGRGHVGDERSVADDGRHGVLHATEGLVAADVHDR